MIKLLAFFICAAFFYTSSAQTTPLWKRYPAISLDGKTIVFGYKGVVRQHSSTIFIHLTNYEIFINNTYYALLSFKTKLWTNL